MANVDIKIAFLEFFGIFHISYKTLPQSLQLLGFMTLFSRVDRSIVLRITVMPSDEKKSRFATQSSCSRNPRPARVIPLYIFIISFKIFFMIFKILKQPITLNKVLKIKNVVFKKWRFKIYLLTYLCTILLLLAWWRIAIMFMRENIMASLHHADKCSFYNLTEDWNEIFQFLFILSFIKILINILHFILIYTKDGTLL